MNDFYFNKASVPRPVLAAESLRDALGVWGTKRLLAVAEACEEAGKEDRYRREFGRIHSRYANLTFLISEAIESQNLKYTVGTLLHWISEDFERAETGAQKDAAGLCGAELNMIMERFKRASL